MDILKIYGLSRIGTNVRLQGTNVRLQVSRLFRVLVECFVSDLTKIKLCWIQMIPCPNHTKETNKTLYYIFVILYWICYVNWVVLIKKKKNHWSCVTSLTVILSFRARIELLLNWKTEMKGDRTSSNVSEPSCIWSGNQLSALSGNIGF